MFKRLFKKKGLLSIVLALPFLGVALGFIPLQASLKPTQEIVMQDQKQLNILSSLMIERMELSKDLAVYKWNNTLPIDELENEQTFLTQMLEKTTPLNVDAKFVKNFFKAQIEASKMINIENFETWVNKNIHKHDYTPDPATLQKKIQDIDEKLVLALKDICTTFSGSQKEALKVELGKILQDKGFSRDVIDSATHF